MPDSLQDRLRAPRDRSPSVRSLMMEAADRLDKLEIEMSAITKDMRRVAGTSGDWTRPVMPGHVLTWADELDHTLTQRPCSDCRGEGCASCGGSGLEVDESAEVGAASCTRLDLSVVDALRMIAEIGVRSITEARDGSMETVVTLTDGRMLTVAPGDYYTDSWTLTTPEDLP